MKAKIIKKVCGCETTLYSFEDGFTQVWGKLCDICSAMKKTVEEHKELEKFERATTDIICEKCGIHICWCNDSDLNCSYFYCDNCKNNIIK